MTDGSSPAPRPTDDAQREETPTVVDRRSAVHFGWGDGCDGWHLVRDPALSVVEERMPPGTSEVRHYHRAARQFFYVLRGRLTMEAGGRRRELTAGQGIEIAPGLAHQVHNASDVDAEFLVISCPPSQGDRVAVK